MDPGVAAILGALAGAAGAVATGWVNARASRERAAEDRRQQRIERAYLHLLDVINAGRKIVETERIDHAALDYKAVDDLVDTVWTQMDAFGSDIVRVLLNSWRGAWVVFKIDIHNARREGSLDRFMRDRLRENADRVIEAGEKIRLQVAAEFSGHPVRKGPAKKLMRLYRNTT